MKVIYSTGEENIAKVYIGETEDSRLLEFVESVQPPIPREKKWVLIVSTLYGCPIGCKICDAGEFYHGKISADVIMAQIDYMVVNRYPDRKIPVEKFKIQFARMGDPVLNPDVLEVLEKLPLIYEAPGLMPSISTIAPIGREAYFDRLIGIKERLYPNSFQMQFSIHSTDEAQRDRLIPVKKWNFSQIAGFGDKFHKTGARKIALNFALAEGIIVDEKVLRNHFDPEIFLIKITPVNPTYRAKRNSISSHIQPDLENYEVIERLRGAGFEVILSIGELSENDIGSNCGQHVMNYLNDGNKMNDSYTYPLISQKYSD